jgi:hypothetical protein
MTQFTLNVSSLPPKVFLLILLDYNLDLNMPCGRKIREISPAHGETNIITSVEGCGVRGLERLAPTFTYDLAENLIAVTTSNLEPVLSSTNITMVKNLETGYANLAKFT